MRSSLRAVSIILVTIILVAAANAQLDDICAAAGFKPSMDPPFPPVPYIYGFVRVKGPSSGPKPQQIVVSFSDRQQPMNRQVIGNSGTYCFRRNNGVGGTMVVEIDGKEVARRSVPSVGIPQQREDFDLELQDLSPDTLGVVSTKFLREPNQKTVELYKKLAKAEKSEDMEMAIWYLQKIVSADPEDYPAWGKLGARYLDKQSLPEAEAAFKKAVQLNAEYTPALIGTGMISLQKKQIDAAIDIFKRVTLIDPTSGMAYKLLGQSYLYNRNGKLGLEALDQAIKVDPTGMAECHLIKGNLFELNGAKQLATAEYKAFLTKVPDYKDKKKLEKFIAANPN